ncbi:hypothetical protein C9I49_20740 [Pseudomonas prosekii]|uniref:Uncharacterized protein n=1 Tax=Pseudomonas prosekii TaxID=1148509 RepID=A0A2U2D428_9PSED|nr:hypothetical protein C9I49_20740 [Pseudomonas prosekii]
MLAMAVGQVMRCDLIHRDREQAHSYKRCAGGHRFSKQQKSLWEPSLLAMTVGEVMRCGLIGRHREQAHSYRGICAWTQIFRAPEIPVGAELAREGGGSGDVMWPDTPPSRASSLLQRICGRKQIF